MNEHNIILQIALLPLTLICTLTNILIQHDALGFEIVPILTSTLLFFHYVYLFYLERTHNQDHDFTFYLRKPCLFATLFFIMSNILTTMLGIRNVFLAIFQVAVGVAVLVERKEVFQSMFSNAPSYSSASSGYLPITTGSGGHGVGDGGFVPYTTGAVVAADEGRADGRLAQAYEVIQAQQQQIQQLVKNHHHGVAGSSLPSSCFQEADLPAYTSSSSGTSAAAAESSSLVAGQDRKE